MVEETAKTFYEACKDFLVPSLSNDSVYQLSGEKSETFFVSIKGEIEKLDKTRPCFIRPLPTEGRFDMRSPDLEHLSPEDRALSKELYKGRANFEYHFNMRNWDDLSLVVTKAGTNCMLVMESPEAVSEKVKEMFTKAPGWSTYYSKGGWMKVNRAIEIAKALDISLKKYMHHHRGNIKGNEFGF